VVWYWLRARLRRRGPAWIVTGVLVGLVAGGVLTVLAGARRTATAYDRFLEEQRAVDVAATATCAPPPDGSDLPADCVDRLRSLSVVEDLSVVELYEGQITTADGRSLQPDPLDPCFFGAGAVFVLGDPSGRFGSDLNRFKFVEGRPADPRRADEVVVSHEAARRLDLHPGDELRLTLVSGDFCDDPTRWPLARRVRITGVEVAPLEVRPPSGGYSNFVHVTPAFSEAQRADRSLDAVGIRWRDDEDTSMRAVSAAGIELEDLLQPGEQSRQVRRGIRPLATGMWILGCFAAAAAIAVVGHVLATRARLEGGELWVLEALGVGTGQRFLATATHALVIAGVAAVVAVVTASLASGLLPIGPARLVEPHPGRTFDVVALGVGAVATFLAVVLLVAVPVWGLARRPADPRGRPAGPRPSAVAERLLRLGVPMAPLTGVRAALEPLGRRGSVARSSLAAVALGIVGVTGALTFAGNLNHLRDTPRLVGWNWDVVFEYPATEGRDGEPVPMPEPRVIGTFAQDTRVERVSAGTFASPFPGRLLQLGADHVETQVMSFGTGANAVTPSVVRGRAPVASHEILLGTETAERLGVGIGELVDARGRQGDWDREDTWRDIDIRLEVVGIGIIPTGGEASPLGTGAAVTLDGLTGLRGGRGVSFNALYLDVQEGTDPESVIATAAEELGLSRQSSDFQLAFEDLEVLQLLQVRAVDDLPTYMAGFMGLMAAVVLLYIVVTIMRARRRELAVLQALGFGRRQLHGTAAWQAAALAGLAAAVGIPVGVLAGRGVWLVYADRLGVVSEAVLPPMLLLLVPGVIAVALLVAAGPAWVATRVPPGPRLRAE
jgi:hypothetical protein